MTSLGQGVYGLVGSAPAAHRMSFSNGAVREFTGQSLLLTNSLPNFFFHCTTAYDILRESGISSASASFMGTPVKL